MTGETTRSPNKMKKIKYEFYKVCAHMLLSGFQHLERTEIYRKGRKKRRLPALLSFSMVAYNSIHYISCIKWHKYRLLTLQNRNELYSISYFFSSFESESGRPIKLMQSKWRWCAGWMWRGRTTARKSRKMWKKMIIPQQTLNRVTKEFQCNVFGFGCSTQNKITY